MEVKERRILERIEAMAAFNGSPGNGITRFSYSEEDRKARDYIAMLCREMGLNPKTDGFGNIRIRYEGTDPSLPPVLVGSHIDTVRCGGKYDGMLGVMGALEILSVFHEAGYRPLRSVEAVVFAEEEGSNFGATLFGSKALLGKHKPGSLQSLSTAEGVNCLEYIRAFGLEPGEMKVDILQPGGIHAMLELHIEQGIVLERVGRSIGVVRAIAGMSTVRVRVTGASDHAGATPMDMRRDPMVGAARLIAGLRDIARTQTLSTTVATVGQITCLPNMPNVIGQEVTFTVDVRDIRQQGIDAVLELFGREAQRVSADEGVEVSMEGLGTSPCISLSPKIAGVIEACADEMGIPTHAMNSGAVHDAALMAGITDTGMIFIPSRAGKSHCPQEYSAPQDIALGCNLLLQAVCRLCSE